MRKNTSVIVDYVIQEIIVNILEDDSKKPNKYFYPFNNNNIEYMNHLIMNKKCDVVIRNSKFIILSNDFNRNKLQY